jgi:tRNA-2-methylthio-N6-dimethylallyladenosine synthase
MVVTPPPKYPTTRGESVDARQIVATGGGRQHLTSMRLQHILLASQELAADSLHQLRSSRITFDELAQQLSACSLTRDMGGAIGWMNLQEESNEHLDEILPLQARTQVSLIPSKPGDIVMVESNRGYHLVQIVDVTVANVRSMATLIRQRKDKSTLTLQGKTYKMETMGCQMNMADSERMEGQLQSLGLIPLGPDAKVSAVDVIVLNTCSIRDHAEQKVYSYIGPYAKRKREGEDVTIIVAGCVAQQEGQALLRRAPEVDLVMGPQYANRLGDLLEDVAMGNQVVATEAALIMQDSTKPRRQSSVCAWVNVIYGCNERCSFCIVPTTRGVEQSRPVESIVAEVTELVQQGYKEVTLLGQNIDAFGRDMLPKRKFSDLLRTVGEVQGLERLRFVTSHPRYMSLGVVDAVAETPSVCESFHIPFQSGSDTILATMGRGHTREKYLHIVSRIRSRIPEASITADVIVGFPGETEKDFLDTLSLMREVVFDSVNTAAYSPRPNTPAATMTNQVDDAVKQERLQRVNKLNLEHAKERRARIMGQVVQVLVEERNVKLPNQVMGRSRHGYIVYFEGDIDDLRGQLVNIKIDTCEQYYLAGSIVENL